MKKILFFAIILLNGIANAQVVKLDNQTETYQETKKKTYTIKHNKGVLSLNLGKAVIEGYEGSEIILEKEIFLNREDERSKGLQSISVNGTVDNTGIGVNVTLKNDIVEVNDTNRMAVEYLRIKVPKNMKVIVKNQSEFDDLITIKSINNEIEFDSRYSSLMLENVSGPVTAKSLYGNIEAKFSKDFKSPISLVSIYGFVDLALPANTNTDFKISTKFGEILTEPSLNIKLNPNKDNQLFKNTMTGIMNAGGNDIQIKTDYNKIYIRSSK